MKIEKKTGCLSFIVDRYAYCRFLCAKFTIMISAQKTIRKK